MLFLDKDFGVFIVMIGDDLSYLYWLNIYSFVLDLYLGEKFWLNVMIICLFLELFCIKLILFRF